MSNLTNIGLNRGFTPSAIRRFIFCKTTTDGGVANKLTMAEAAVLSNWQTKFDVYNFVTDPSVKFMASPLVRAVATEEGEPVVFELEDYKVKMRNAEADLNWTLLDMEPYIYGNMRGLENETLSVYPVTDETEVLGIPSGLDFLPLAIKIGSFSVPFYPFRSFDAASQGVATFRFNAGTDLDSVAGITIASADVTSDLDFWSLKDVTGTVTAPAVTGCDIILSIDNSASHSPEVIDYLTDSNIAFGDITFTDQDGVSGDITLAGAGSLSYSSSTKKHTINEAALLTTGHTYTCKITESKFDITCDDVVIP